MSRAIYTTKKDQWVRQGISGGIGGKCWGCGVNIGHREVHYRSGNKIVCPTCYLTIPDRQSRSTSSSNIPGHREGEEISTKIKFWVAFIIIGGIIIMKGFNYLKDLIMN